MSEVVEYLFVYGTLRKAVRNVAGEVLGTHAKCLGVGRISGKLYEVNGYPGVTLSDEQCDQVVGEIYELLDAKRVFTALDSYEGVSCPPHAEDEYLKCSVALLGDSNKSVTVYVYQHPTEGLKRIMSGDYLSQ